MLLHQAVQKARKDIGLSQKKLAELAGIQRRQLATLEKGGNITLSTLRKVLAHLPNLETFTLDAVTATVRREVPPEEHMRAVDDAMKLLGEALRDMVGRVTQGEHPSEQNIATLRKATERMAESAGYDAADVERERQRIRAAREVLQGPFGSAFLSLVNVAGRRRRRLKAAGAPEDRTG